MIHWDKMFLEKLRSLNMAPELYTRFKDDIAVVIESLEKDSKSVEEKIVTSWG